MSTPLVLLLDDNLLSSARITPQLQALGRQVKIARRLPETLDAPELVLINLGSRPLNGVTLIAACRARFPAARLVGFCGHLEVEIRREAKARGIDRLLTNDQAMAELATALAPMLSNDAAPTCPSGD
jgi:CheY-like chemotaxis protein